MSAEIGVESIRDGPKGATSPAAAASFNRRSRLASGPPSRMARIAGREEMALRRRQNAMVFRFARTTDGKPADPGHGDVGMALVDPPPTLGRKRHIARFMPEQEGEAGRFAGQPSERRIRPRGRHRNVRDERRQRARPPRRRDRIPADVTFLCIAHFRRGVAHSTLWS